jgi:hypothetical protein
MTVIDRYRKELNTDYFDILLLHCVRTNDWAETFKPARDVFDEAKQKRIIRAHGASCHGLVPIRTFPDQKWLDVSLNRINNAGVRMDNLRGTEDGEGDVTEVVGHLEEDPRPGHRRHRNEDHGRRRILHTRAARRLGAIRDAVGHGRRRHHRLQEHRRNRRSHRAH